MPASPVGCTNTELQDCFNYAEPLYRAEVETGQQGGDSTWSPSHHLGCSLSPQKAKKIDPGTPCGPRLGVLLGEEGRAEGGEEVGSGGCTSERKAKVRGLRDIWLG